MAEINGTNNNSVQSMMDSLSSRFLDNGSTTANKTADTVNSFAPTNSKDRTSAILDDLTRRFINGTNSTTSTSSPETVKPMPATEAPKKKKKKKKGFFGKLFGGIGKALGKIGGFLKKALPIISTIAMFIPGIGTAVGMGLKIATAAMGAIDGIKSGNIFGALTSVAGAFTGGATNMLGKLGNVGGFIQKGVDMFKNSGVGSLVTRGFDLFNKGKDWLSNATAGLGGKVTDFLTNKGGDLFKNLTSGIGGKLGSWLTEKGPSWISNLASKAGSAATNWLNEKATSIFDKVTKNPTVQKITNFFNTGIGNSTIGQTLLDLFTAKKG
jgi:hypothetical protein